LAIDACASRQLDVAELLELVLLDPVEYDLELVLHGEAGLGVPDLDANRNDVLPVVDSEALDRVHVARELNELHFVRLQGAESNMAANWVHDDHLAELVALHDLWRVMIAADGQVLEAAHFLLLCAICFGIFLIFVRKHALQVQEHVDVPGDLRLRTVVHIAAPLVRLAREAAEGVHEFEREPVFALELFDLLAFPPRLLLPLFPLTLLLFLSLQFQSTLFLPFAFATNAIIFLLFLGGGV
jgi:hypothetical protein